MTEVLVQLEERLLTKQETQVRILHTLVCMGAVV